MATFNHSTLSDTSALITEVQTHLKRGTISTTSFPTTAMVTNFLVRGKEKLIEMYGFTWRRKFVYAATTLGEYRYAMPVDYAGGGTVIRDLTQNIRLTMKNPVIFDTLYPDIDGDATAAPEFYTIKGMEMWLQAKANGSYTFELEYSRSGDDSTAETWDYIPEAMLFKIADYATYRSFVLLEQWDSAKAYKGEWEEDVAQGKRDDGKKKWASTGYQCINWHYTK
jgi:hypothetical protein